MSKVKTPRFQMMQRTLYSRFSPGPLQGQKRSRLNVRLIVGDAVYHEKGDEFLLKGHAVLLLLLVARACYQLN